MKIYPSLISADILNLEKVITTLNSYADGYHLDVMDDHFVPNLTWGPMFINAIAKKTSLPLHIHLMVSKPQNWVDRLNLSHKDSFVFHIETMVDDYQTNLLINKIKKNRVKVGVALNPKTPIDAIEKFLPIINEVLVMSVTPGFSGQQFIDVTKKVDQLVAFRQQQSLAFEIGMDGGINTHNITTVARHHVDIVGIASALFTGDDYVSALQDLRKILL